MSFSNCIFRQELFTYSLYSPLALPGALGYLLQGRVQAVNVVADVTVVTQQQEALIIRTATALTYSAVQTTPTFLQDDSSHLDCDTVWVVALSALDTDDQLLLRLLANATTSLTDVLKSE